MWEPGFLAFLTVSGFGIIVLAATNKAIRFAFPVIVALPFLAGILCPKRTSGSHRSASLAAGLIFCGLLVAGAPMRYRAESRVSAGATRSWLRLLRCNAKESFLLPTVQH